VTGVTALQQALQAQGRGAVQAPATLQLQRARRATRSRVHDEGSSPPAFFLLGAPRRLCPPPPFPGGKVSRGGRLTRTGRDVVASWHRAPRWTADSATRRTSRCLSPYNAQSAKSLPRNSASRPDAPVPYGTLRGAGLRETHRARWGSCAGRRRVPTLCCVRGGQVNRANETIQCENCDRILEERYNDFRVVPVNIERESPYCVVPDDALAQHKFEEKLEGDPYHASGFITAFSQISVQQQGAFTLTARTFAGELAELERILGELDLDAPNTASDGAAWSFRSSAHAGSVNSGKGAASAQESKESDKTAHSAASAAPAAPASAVGGQHGAHVDNAACAHTPMVTGAKGEVGRSQTDGRFVSVGRRGDLCNEQQRSCKLPHLLSSSPTLPCLTFCSSYQ
jgi:hypothetical protein